MMMIMELWFVCFVLCKARLGEGGREDRVIRFRVGGWMDGCLLID